MIALAPPLLILVIFQLLVSHPTHAEELNTCGLALSHVEVEGSVPDAVQRLAHQVASDSEGKLAQVGSAKRRGYALLIGSMVGSAALTTYATSHLGTNFQFLSVFLAQLSALGVYSVGAPIWEPLASRFRQVAFGIQHSSKLERVHFNPQLEATWRRTQEHYSLNAQMSRNVISQFIFSVRQNFYEAYRAHLTGDRSYCTDQIAEAAYRFRTLFRDIQPDDPSVAAAVRSAFTHHVVLDQAFVQTVWHRLQRLDPQFEEGQAYYQATLHAWLGATEN